MKTEIKIVYFAFGPFRIDLKNRELLRSGKPVAITNKSFEILLFLIKRHGTVITKEEIIEAIWDEDYVEPTALVQQIYRIRKALRDGDLAVEYIQTVSKLGYRFIGEVETGLDESAEIKSARRYSGSSDSEIAAREAGRTSTDLSGPVDLDDRLERDANSKKREKTDVAKVRRRFYKTISGRAAIGLAAILVLFAGYSLFFHSEDTDITNIRSLAILPFDQIGELGDEKLGLGMADTLISRFSSQDKIAISPTVSIVKFLEKGADNPIKIGKELGVEAVLVGTIQKEGSMVRIIVQIIDVERNVPLWSDKFDSPYSNIFSLQDRVSSELARKLSLDLSGGPKPELEIQYTQNIDAYKEYSKGLFERSKKTPEAFIAAIGHLKKAINLDSDFSKAYALLADTYSLVGYNRYDVLPTDEAMQKAEEMVARALKLDPKSSDALTTLALINMHKGSYEKAQSQLDEAIRLKPNNSTAHLRIAWIAALSGDLEKAIGQMKLARNLDPQSDTINRALAAYLMLARKPDEALALSQRIMEIGPPSDEVNIFLAEIYEQKEEYKRAIEERKIVQTKEPLLRCLNLFALSRLYAKTNKLNKSRLILKQATGTEKCEGYDYALALTYLHLGETDKVLPLVKKDEKNPWHFLNLKNDYNLDRIRKTPEFQSYVAEYEEKRKHDSNVRS